MECDATAWLVDFPNPYSHRQLGRNPFAQHQNYPKIDSSTKDYPKTTLTFFAFCRTVRKCVKALSENYPTKWWRFFSTIRIPKNTIRKCFRSSTPAHDNRKRYGESGHPCRIPLSCRLYSDSKSLSLSLN